MGCLIHKWDHCSCLKCGKIRKVKDEDHKFEGCKCAYCGFQRDMNHNWNHGKCSICGAVDEKKGHSKNFKFELDGENVDIFCADCDQYLGSRRYDEVYDRFTEEIKNADAHGATATLAESMLEKLKELKK